MAVQANWFVDLSGVDEQDPFEGEAQKVGRRIDLLGEPDLTEQLVGLLDEETRLLNEGVTCAIKDANNTCCSACPIRCVDLSPIASLCSVGVRQEAVLTTLAVHRERTNEATG